MKAIQWKYYILFLFFFISNSCLGQEKSTVSFEIESDPIAYIFKGYSLHVAIVKSKYRLSLGVFGLKQPEFVLQNKNFSIFSSGFDFKSDYLFRGENGFFLGVQTTYGREVFALNNTTLGKEDWGATLGFRTGYRYMFGEEINHYKGFYLVPWITISYAFNAQGIELGGEKYEQPRWIPFPTIHLGWRF